MRNIIVTVSIAEYDTKGMRVGKAYSTAQRGVPLLMPPLGTQLAAALISHLDDELKYIEEEECRGGV